jgi:hypothetical protein
MAHLTYDEGYRDGWESVAGLRPLPGDPTPPQAGEPRDYELGFQYGKSDALERYEPTGGDCPPPAPR